MAVAAVIDTPDLSASLHRFLNTWHRAIRN